jgi:hypothetical protein
MECIMSTSTTVEVVRPDDPGERAETVAVAGFLAGYFGSTRTSYATDLRLFATWCHKGDLTLFSVRRAHLELFGRWMEESGRMRSTVARRLSTLASVKGAMTRNGNTAWVAPGRSLLA